MKKIIIGCRKCGYVPTPNKEKSNKSWNVIDEKICPNCKIKLEFIMEQE
jgi:hypothetical protein